MLLKRLPVVPSAATSISLGNVAMARAEMQHITVKISTARHFEMVSSCCCSHVIGAQERF